MKTRLLLLSSSALIAALSATAAPTEVKTHAFGPGADVFEKDTTFKEALHSNVPARQKSSFASPSFVMVTKGGKFMLSLGGAVKVTVGGDMGHPIPDADEFTTSEIPMHPMDGNGGKFNISAQQSSLYLNFIALPGDANQIGAFISANLLNDNYTPNLQYAYLKYRGFQAGYDYNLFSDPGACPTTIDYEGPNSFTAIPTAGIRYGIDFGRKKAWNFSVGAELPFESFTTVPGKTVTVNQRCPDIPLALRYSWDGGASWIRLSGVIRNMYYRNEVAGRNIDKVGYGLQLSGTAAITPQLRAFYMGAYGKGLSSYFQDIYGLGLDLMPDPENPRAMKCVEAWGAYGGLQYTFNPQWMCSATYSHLRTYADKYNGGSDAWSGQYKYGQYVVANIFYKINGYFQTGIEYLWGRRANYSGVKCSDNRIQCMFQMSF